ncbi:2-phospho-L-lactate guanylyltransferase [Halorubrum sp. Ea1]|uniref:2-phospho-L-lactate guanylyltransferase n=1 Tax=Halorubrum sp. Ea1 TaxID=1480718 RepID=UPI000B98526D|nr:2-phospho-L-lactate guanylyltransferase [Halorubrum sp. Ea1]OYR54200.1 2-phospho-L-lactate guanylyltransferase [Halorubrum sp. Ea1]
MEVLVPFSTDRPKSRLSAVLDPDERKAFARAMLRDVLDAVRAAGGDPRVLATGPVEADLACPVDVDERPLTDAVNAALDERTGDGGGGGEGNDGDPDPVAVVMADLALATPEALRELFAAGREADVAIAPGRGGGTNAFVASHPAFRVDYHGASYLDHRRIAAEVGASVAVVDSHRLATDVDEPADLAELLIHAEADEGSGGRAARWLRDAGFALDATEGRVGVERE